MTIISLRKTLACVLTLFSIMSYSDENTWRIATDQNFPPYVYKEGKDVKGIYVDLVNAVMEKLNVPYKVNAYPWARVVGVTDVGQVDFGFPFIAQAERFEKYLMTGPLHTGKIVLMSRIEDQSIQYQSFEDLKGLRIGTVRGYAYDEDFDTADYFIRDDSAKDNINILNKLISKRVDLIIGDEAVLMFEATKMGINKQIRILPKAVKDAVRYVAFPKSKAREAQLFSRALSAIKSNGTYDEIVNHYR